MFWWFGSWTGPKRIAPATPVGRDGLHGGEGEVSQRVGLETRQIELRRFAGCICFRRAISQFAMGRLVDVKVRDVLKMLRQDGWLLRNQEGSHRQFVHPAKLGKLTVAGHESDEMPPKTLNSIMRRADIP